MLPCLNKQFFGIDCLGCGAQRALLSLVQGDFLTAFQLYPAIYTILIFLFFLALNFKYKFKYRKKIIITFITFNTLIIVVSYFIKMKNLFLIS